LIEESEANQELLDGEDEIERETHEYRAKIVDGKVKSTSNLYQRHINHYINFFETFQTRHNQSINAFPITPAKAALFIRHELQRQKKRWTGKRDLDGDPVMEAKEGTNVGISHIKQVR
jgi:hypothetical protein